MILTEKSNSGVIEWYLNGEKVNFGIACGVIENSHRNFIYYEYTSFYHRTLKEYLLQQKIYIWTKLF